MADKYPELLLIADEDANDSDKIIFTVPDGEAYELLWVYVEFVATATVGNRRVALRIRDASDDIVFEIWANIAQTAGTTVYYTFMPGGTDTIIGGGSVSVSLPVPCLIPAGFDVQIIDINVVDAAADDMVVQAMARRLQPAA